MEIRICQHGNHIALAEIFTAAIHTIASKDYTSEQCLAWSDQKANHEYWRKRCELKRPFVAVFNSEIAGFLELDPDGHIDCAYINPKFQRRGHHDTAGAARDRDVLRDECTSCIRGGINHGGTAFREVGVPHNS